MREWSGRGLFLLGIFCWVAFFALGVFQFFAIYDFFHKAWQWPLLLALLAGTVIAYVPVLGSLCGMFAAVNVWGWEWWQAVLLFFWPALFSAGRIWYQAARARSPMY